MFQQYGIARPELVEIVERIESGTGMPEKVYDGVWVGDTVPGLIDGTRFTRKPNTPIDIVPTNVLY